MKRILKETKKETMTVTTRIPIPKPGFSFTDKSKYNRTDKHKSSLV